MTPGHIADAITASAKLKKWPSLNGERVSARDGGIPYTLVEASLADCIRRLATKPESQRHLYEIHTSDETVLTAAEALALQNDQPPSEEHSGGELRPPSRT